ncbi:YggT family protein [Acidobacteriota bacterium]
MILFANFLLAASRIIHIVLMVYIWIIVGRAILSWIRVPSLYQVAVIIYRITEPVLKPVRKFVPPSKMGGLDISPMIVILILWFIDMFVVRSMTLYAYQILQGHTYSL